MYKFLRFTIVSLLSAASLSASAAEMSPAQHPSAFCDLAAKLGYSSNGFNPKTGGCGTEMQPLSSATGKNGLPNNLAFYSMGEYGNPSRLQRVSFILNVNNERETPQAHAELVRVALPVASQLLGVEPQGLAATIRAGGTKSWNSGAWKVEVITTRWPTKLGHDVTVRFSPAAK